jgi:hypothetical protein
MFWSGLPLFVPFRASTIILPPHAYSLEAPFSDRWAPHRDNTLATLTQLTNGVGLRGGSAGASIGDNGVAIWAFKLWTGGFETACRTRKLDTNVSSGAQTESFLIFYFNCQGDGTAGFPVDMSEWDSDSKAATHTYRTHMKGARLTLYYRQSGDTGETQAVSVAIFKADGTATTISPTGSTAFPMLVNQFYSWNFSLDLQTETFTVEQTDPSNVVRTERFVSSLFATWADAGNFGFLATALRNAEVYDFRVAGSEVPVFKTFVPAANLPEYIRFYPLPLAVKSATPATLATVLSTAAAGDLIQCEAGSNYTGTYTSAANGTQAAPIVIKGQPGAVLTGSFVITGDWTAVDSFAATGTASKVTLTGAHCRATRLAFSGQTYSAGAACVRLEGAWAHFDRSTATNCARTLWEVVLPGATDAWVRRLRDYSNSSQDNARGRIGHSETDHPVVARCIHEFNRYADYGDAMTADVINNASSENIHALNTLTNSGISGFSKKLPFNHRGGENCSWVGNIIDHGDLRIAARGQKVWSNYIADEGLKLMAGTVDPAAGVAPGSGELARCVDVVLADNQVTQLVLGDDAFAGSTLGPLRTAISLNQPNYLLGDVTGDELTVEGANGIAMTTLGRDGLPMTWAVA